MLQRQRGDTSVMSTNAAVEAFPRRVLVTYFQPFGGRVVNSSRDAAQGALAEAKALPDVEVSVLEVPVAYQTCWDVVEAQLRRTPFDVVLAFGEGKQVPTVETIGTNMYDMSMADNTGAFPLEDMIEPDGPPFVAATLSAAGIRSALAAAGIACEESRDAGSFCCNELLFQLAYNSALVRQSGLIHIPPVNEANLTQRHRNRVMGHIVLRALTRPGVIVAPPEPIHVKHSLHA